MGGELCIIARYTVEDFGAVGRPSGSTDGRIRGVGTNNPLQVRSVGPDFVDVPASRRASKEGDLVPVGREAGRSISPLLRAGYLALLGDTSLAGAVGVHDEDIVGSKSPSAVGEGDPLTVGRPGGVEVFRGVVG